jgi:sulfatase maturation enzyme AslB (radical SAM superfamily)
MQSAQQPVWVWLDPTLKCNIACSLCYTREGHGQVDLDRPSLERILANITSDDTIDIQELTFNWRGEPLMNKSFPSLLAFLTSQKLPFPIQFHTNAMLLTNRLAQKVIEGAGECSIYISIDGGSRESHDANRGRGSFSRAVTGAWNLLKARGGSKFPRIILYQLDLREAVSCYDREFLDLAHAVDSWQRYQPILPTGDANELASEPETPGGSLLVANWRNVRHSREIPRGPCFWMGYALCVSPKGDASVCLLSHRPDGVLGNVLVDRPGDILKRAQTLRDFIQLNGRCALPHCQSCRKSEGVPRPPKPVANLQLSGLSTVSSATTDT